MIQLVAQTNLEVVLQIGTHAGPVKHGGNAVRCQVCSRANAGAHQDLGRPERTCGQHHFTAGCGTALYAALNTALNTPLTPHHARRPTVVCHYPVYQCTGLHRQVRAFGNGLEKAVGGAPALPLVLIDVDGAYAVVFTAIEVFHRRYARLQRRVVHRVQQGPLHAGGIHMPFSIGAMMLAGPKHMVFQLLEIRQHVRPAPAFQAQVSPPVIVGSLPPDTNHAIDGG